LAEETAEYDNLIEANLYIFFRNFGRGRANVRPEIRAQSRHRYANVAKATTRPAGGKGAFAWLGGHVRRIIAIRSTPINAPPRL